MFTLFKIFKLFLSAILLAVFILTGCNKNDNPTEPNENMGFSISGTLQTQVIGEGYKIQLAVRNDSTQAILFVAGESDITNNSSFNIKTVKDIPSDLLEPIKEDLPEGLTVSNTNTKSQDADLLLVNKDGIAISEVNYQDNQKAELTNSAFFNFDYRFWY